MPENTEKSKINLNDKKWPNILKQNADFRGMNGPLIALKCFRLQFLDFC